MFKSALFTDNVKGAVAILYSLLENSRPTTLSRRSTQDTEGIGKSQKRISHSEAS
jgi:hypothetical protein